MIGSRWLKRDAFRADAHGEHPVVFVVSSLGSIGGELVAFLRAEHDGYPWPSPVTEHVLRAAFVGLS